MNERMLTIGMMIGYVWVVDIYRGMVGARSKKGCKLAGKLNVELACKRLRAGRPCEGGSAKLSRDGM